MATKGVPRAPSLVSTPQVAIIFRRESVSGHPGPGEAKKIPNIARKKIQTFQNFQTSTLANPPFGAPRRIEDPWVCGLPLGPGRRQDAAGASRPLPGDASAPGGKGGGGSAPEAADRGVQRVPERGCQLKGVIEMCAEALWGPHAAVATSYKNHTDIM